MKKIGFVGLGHMGTPMVTNLLKGGYQVKVYDIRPMAVQPIMEQGATSVTNLADVAVDVDVLFTMLQNSEQVSQVCSAPQGLFNTLKKGVIFIDCSSIDVATSRDLHHLADQADLEMLDAPVSGGIEGAIEANLTFMVGGKEAVFAKAKPILQVMGKQVIYAGPAGNGQAAKICNNMVLGISMIAISEAFVLAEKLGLDAKKFFEISSHASAACWSLTSYAPVPGLVANVPANKGYKAGFSANMMLKDLLLSQEAAHAVNIHTSLGAKATDLYSKFVQQGNEAIDFSAIIRMIAKNFLA